MTLEPVDDVDDVIGVSALDMLRMLLQSGDMEMRGRSHGQSHKRMLGQRVCFVIACSNVVN